MDEVELLVSEAFDEGVATEVIRPAAVLPEEAARGVLMELALRDVRMGGYWWPEPGLWRRYNRPWGGPDGGPGDSQLIGTIQVAYGVPARYEITLFPATVTTFGTGAGWVVETLCNEALAFGGFTLADCPRADLMPSPDAIPDPGGDRPTHLLTAPSERFTRLEQFRPVTNRSFARWCRRKINHSVLDGSARRSGRGHMSHASPKYRLAVRAAAVSSGALVAGVLGMGTAVAGVGTDPVSTLSGTTGHTLTHTVNTDTKHKKTKKASSDPVTTLVKTTTHEVKSTSKTVSDTLNQLTGTSTSSPTHQPKSTHRHHSAPKPGGQHATATRHRAQHGAQARHRAAGPYVARVASIDAAAIARLNRFADVADFGGPGLSRRPLVAQAPQLSTPAAPADTPQASLKYDLLHPTAMLPQVVTDPTLRLELLLSATIIAGAVAGAHLVVVRRRISRALAG